MSHIVLALGVAVVTVSGCVWYVPAVADLRAGADRPDSRRTAAAACLCGWSTTGVIAGLLLVTEAWWIPCATAVAGAAVTAGFRIRATVQRRREAREAARRWAALRHRPPLIGADRSRGVCAALLGSGLVAGVAVASLGVLAAGPENGADWPAAAAAPAAVVGLFLTIAITYTRMNRRRATAGRTRSLR